MGTRPLSSAHLPAEPVFCPGKVQTLPLADDFRERDRHRAVFSPRRIRGEAETEGEGGVEHHSTGATVKTAKTLRAEFFA